MLLDGLTIYTLAEVDKVVQFNSFCLWLLYAGRGITVVITITITVTVTSHY